MSVVDTNKLFFITNNKFDLLVTQNNLHKIYEKMPALSRARANSIIMSNYILTQHMKENIKLKKEKQNKTKKKVRLCCK